MARLTNNKMGKSNKFSLTTKSHSSTRVNPYDKITLNALNVSCPDKQIVLPKLDSNGAQLIFIELYSLFIFIIALGTQYLNLYRSVWWLSKSRNSQPINYHLIDLDVSEFSLIFIGQSSLISILRALLHKATIPSKLNLLAKCQHHHQNHNHNLHQQQPITATTTSSTAFHQATANNNTNNNSNNSSSSDQQSQKQHQTQTLHQQTQSNSIATNHTTLATIVTASASWICNYYLFKCAYRIWTNFGFNGLSCVSYPIVSTWPLLKIEVEFMIFS